MDNKNPASKIHFESVKKSHKNIILTWFSEDHVKEFYYGKGLQNTLRNLELYCQEINNNGRYTFHHWIAFCDGIPFGFLSTSPVTGPYDPKHDSNKWYIEGKQTFTLDLLIGEKNFLGKGLAHKMIQQFILDQYSDADFFIIDPEVENIKAIQAYKKAGFKKVGELCPAFNPKPHIMMRISVDELKKQISNHEGQDHTLTQPLNITPVLAEKLIADQFPEYAHLPITSVEKQGHDHRTYRLGENMLIRMPTAKAYALKVAKEQELLPHIKPHLAVLIPEPIKMGYPSSDYPFHFSIYNWLEGISANHLNLDNNNLETIALQLANFLKELQSINDINGPAPGQHNWWRGDHVNVYDEGARKQIHELSGVINSDKAIALWEQACKTKWNKAPVWIHGDFAGGNIIIKDEKLVGVIDFGGMAIGDPACDLVIAWTFFKGRSREVFEEAMELDCDTWLRAKAWALWKATYELCQIQDKNTHEALIQKRIIDEVLK